MDSPQHNPSESLGIAELPQLVGPEKAQMIRRRARRFSLATARNVADGHGSSFHHSMVIETAEVKREREGDKAAGEGVELQNNHSALSLPTAGAEELYFHRLSGASDIAIDPQTARHRDQSSLQSQAPLAAVMTHRFATSLGRNKSLFVRHPATPSTSNSSPQSPSLRRYLTRSLSSPYFHSWSYGNIDISHQIFINTHQTAKQVLRASAQARNAALFARTPAFVARSPNSSHLQQLSKPNREQTVALNSALSALEYRKELAMERNEKGKVILSGSRRALFLALFDDQFSATDHLEVFIYTHLAWLSASTLLHYLIGAYREGFQKLFNAPSESVATLLAAPAAVAATRKRVMDIVHMWIECCPSDFKSHHAGAFDQVNHVYNELQQFLFSVMDSGASLECSIAEVVLGTLNLAVRPSPNFSARSSLSAPNASTTPHSPRVGPAKPHSKPSHLLELLDMSPKVMAIQLTILEFKRARLLAPENFVTTPPAPLLKRTDPMGNAHTTKTAPRSTSPLKNDSNSASSHNASLSTPSPSTIASSSSPLLLPNLAVIRDSAGPTSPRGTSFVQSPRPTFSPTGNAIVDALKAAQTFVGWVTTEIVTCPNLRARVIVLGNLIEAGHRCYELRNYQSAYSIYSGISRAAVTRLSDTWRGLSAEQMYLWSKLQSRMGNLIDLFDECLEAPSPKIMPLIPAVQLLAQQQVLKDVTKRETWVNFSKFRGISQIIKPMIIAQQIAFPFLDQSLPNIQSFFESHLLSLPYEVLMRYSQDIQEGQSESNDVSSEDEDVDEPSQELEDADLPSQNHTTSASTDDAISRRPPSLAAIPRRTSSKEVNKGSVPIIRMRQHSSSHSASRPNLFSINPSATPPTTGTPSATSKAPSSPPDPASTSSSHPSLPDLEATAIELDSTSPANSRKPVVTNITTFNTPSVPSLAIQSTAVLREEAKLVVKAELDVAQAVTAPPQHLHVRVPSTEVALSSSLPVQPHRTHSRESSGSALSVSSSSSLTPSTGNATETDLSRDKAMKDLHSEVKGKWTRPWAQCSVGADLPRFIRKTVVINETTGEQLFHGGGEREATNSSRGPPETPIIDLIGSLLRTFAVGLEAKKELKAIERSLSLYFAPKQPVTSLATSTSSPTTTNADGTTTQSAPAAATTTAPASIDIAKETDRFCREILGENARVTSLLKVAASQGIVAPAWMKLRLFILSRFGFKDVKKGWNIAVLLGESKVTVVHRKREASNEETTGHPDFEFAWEMRMVFTKKMEKLEHASFAITTVHISPNMNEKKLGTLKTTIQDWFMPGTEVFPKEVFPMTSIIPNSTTLGNSPRDVPSKKDKKRKSFGVVAREWFARHPFKSNAHGERDSSPAPNPFISSTVGSGSSSSLVVSSPGSSKSKLSKSSSKSAKRALSGELSPPETPSSTPAATSGVVYISSTTHHIPEPKRAKLVRRLSDSSSETFSFAHRQGNFTQASSTPTSRKSRHRSGEPPDEKHHRALASHNRNTIERDHITTTHTTSADSLVPATEADRSKEDAGSNGTPKADRRHRRGSAEAVPWTPTVYFPVSSPGATNTISTTNPNNPNGPAGAASVSFGVVAYTGVGDSGVLTTGSPKLVKKKRRLSSEGKKLKRMRSVESGDAETLVYQPAPSASTGREGLVRVDSGSSKVSGGGASTISGGSGAQLHPQQAQNPSSLRNSQHSQQDRSMLRYSSDDVQRGEAGDFDEDERRSGDSRSERSDISWSTDSSWSSSSFELASDHAGTSFNAISASNSPAISVRERRRSVGRRRALSTEAEGREMINIRQSIKQSSSTSSNTLPHPPVSPTGSAPTTVSSPGSTSEISSVSSASGWSVSSPLAHHSSSSIIGSSPASGFAPSSSNPSAEMFTRASSRDSFPLRKKSISSKDSPAFARTERKDKDKRKSKNTIDEDPN